MWRPRRPAAAGGGSGEKAPLEAEAAVGVGVKVAVIAVDGAGEAPVQGIPVVEAAAGGGGEKAPLEAGASVGVKEAEGVPVIAVEGKDEAPVQGDPVAPAVDGKVDAPVVEGAQAIAVEGKGGAEKDEEGIKWQRSHRSRRGKGGRTMWRPRRPAAAGGGGGEKTPLEAEAAVGVGVKDAEGVPVIAVGGKDEAPVQGDPVAPAVDGKVNAAVVEGAQAIAVEGKGGAEKDEEGIKWQRSHRSRRGKGGGAMWRPRQPAAAGGGCGEKAPLEAEAVVGVGVKDVEGAPVIAIDGEGEVSVQGFPVVEAAAGGDGEKAPLEAGASVGVKEAEGVPVIAVGRKDEAPVQGDPVALAVDGKVDAPMVEGTHAIVVEGKGGAEKDEEGIKWQRSHRSRRGKEGGMWRPRRSTAAGGEGGGKAPLEAEVAMGVRVKDAEGAPVIAIDGEGEAPVQGVPVVEAAAGGDGEKAPLEAGASVGVKEAEGIPVIAVGGKDEAPVQGDPVAPAFDGKVDAPAVEAAQAIAVEGKGGAEKDEEGIKWLKHYSSMQSILIVGDGDFSFSLALATAFGSGENLVSTSLDSYEALSVKYAKAESNVMELKRLGATVLHGVDAKMMKLHTCLKMSLFDRIVFNFPHAGFKGKENEVHMIISHKELVKGFFDNARHLLQPYGETHLSHKTGHPYDAWDIVQLAFECCLIMVDRVYFCKEDYPGYNQKRGDSAKCDQPFTLDPCCTFKFCIGDVKKLKKELGNRIGSISSLGNSEVYPGILATDMRPFDLHPLVPAWARPHFPPVNTVHSPITLEPYPLGVAQWEHPGLPVNFYGRERAPYFHHQDTIQPMYSNPDILLTQGGIPPPMRRITGTTLLPPQEQPWYQERPSVELLLRGDYSYSAWEHQRSLHREYEIQRQMMPGGTSMGYSIFLEHPYREYVEKRKRLEMLIEIYGRQ